MCVLTSCRHGILNAIRCTRHTQTTLNEQVEQLTEELAVAKVANEAATKKYQVCIVWYGRVCMHEAATNKKQVCMICYGSACVHVLFDMVWWQCGHVLYGMV